MTLQNKPQNLISLDFNIVTLFPALVQNYLHDALLAKAQNLDIINAKVTDLRQFSVGSYKSVDDKPYGGSDGMLITAPVLEKLFENIHDNNKKQIVIYLSPQGVKWSHHLAKKVINDYANVAPRLGENSAANERPVDTSRYELVLLCGRYAGIDQRALSVYVDLEISIGDYILSGGELAALVLIESLSRYLPGVLGTHQSAYQDSFEVEGLLEAPQYTKPQIWNQMSVPEVLVSGDHQKINLWRKNCSLLMTIIKRPDLIVESSINKTQILEFYRNLTKQDLISFGIDDLKSKDIEASIAKII